MTRDDRGRVRVQVYGPSSVMGCMGDWDQIFGVGV